MGETRNKPAVPQSSSYRPEIIHFPRNITQYCLLFVHSSDDLDFFFHCRHLSNRLIYEILAVAIREIHCAQTLMPFFFNEELQMVQNMVFKKTYFVNKDFYEISYSRKLEQLLRSSSVRSSAHLKAGVSP